MTKAGIKRSHSSTSKSTKTHGSETGPTTTTTTGSSSSVPTTKITLRVHPPPNHSSSHLNHQHSDRDHPTPPENSSFSSFPVVQLISFAARNVHSTYLRSEDNFTTRKNLAEYVPLFENEGTDVIVINPGSRWLRIGRASDAFPVSVPNVIARNTNPASVVIKKEQAAPSEKSDPNNESWETKVNYLDSEVRTMIRDAKRRLVPNSTHQVVNFNSHVSVETIPDHNDPYKVEPTDVSSNPNFVTGEAALRIESSKNYNVRWPIKHQGFNLEHYCNKKEVMADIEIILADALKRDLGLNRGQWRECCVVLIIPDLFDKEFVKEWIGMLLVDMNFKSLLIHQESVCATYGAGVSMGCVVDIGSQHSSVSCVEDGMVIPESRMRVNYGGDDVTTLFVSLLRDVSFPYPEMDLAIPSDMALANDLKEKFCTMNEAEISVQLYDFYVRRPGEKTRKYQFKTYTEVMMAPLSLFIPNLILNWSQHKEIKVEKKETAETGDIDIESELSGQNGEQVVFEEKGTPVVSGPTLDKKDTVELTLAEMIAKSILQCPSDEKRKKLCARVLLIGGAGLTAGLSRHLEARIQLALLTQGFVIEKVEIISAPRDIDPRLLSWKGGAVLNKLETAKDVWLSKREWSLFGEKALQERILFLWH